MSPPVGLPPQEDLHPREDTSSGRRLLSPSASSSSGPALALRDVTVGYHGQPALLAHVDLEVDPGEVIGLVGVSGTGKTSLLKTIAGILPPQSGHVEVLGRARPHRPERGSIGYIPQRLGLVTHASVLDNVLMGALHREPAWRSHLRLPARSTLKAARDVLERVGLAQKEEEQVKHLSGGQQRRVAVARALLQRPKVLLADEFLSELDRATSKIIEDAVLELAMEHGTAIVLVEHHVRKARHMAHRVFEVHAGMLERLPEPPRATGGAGVALVGPPKIEVV
jgi:phosphonate transport system ATP-binding protein